MTRKKPLLIYDGDCGFCQETASRVQKFSRNQIKIDPWQGIPSILAEAGLTEEDAMSKVWFLPTDGRPAQGGAAAVNASLHYIWWARPLALLYKLPGIHQLEDCLYQWVANNRYRMPYSTAQCAMPPSPKLKQQHP